VSNEYKSQEDFFDKVGEHALYPKFYGDCLWPVSVEEMYKHFKERLIEELAGRSDELLGDVELYDAEGSERGVKWSDKSEQSIGEVRG